MVRASAKQREGELRAFLQAAKKRVKNLPSDHLYSMEGKVVLVRGWRYRARNIIRKLYTEALFNFCGVCFVVLVNKRLDSKMPVFLSLVQLGEPVDFGPFTFEYHGKGKIKLHLPVE